MYLCPCFIFLVLFYCRELYEKGMRAFVSFIQSYAKHECNFIFKFKGEKLNPSNADATFIQSTRT